MKQLLTLMTAVLLLVSCKITQNYRFNLDYSGDYSLTFDLTELAEFGVEEGDTIENFFEDVNLDSISQMYRSVKGITSVEVKSEPNILYVNYSFENLEALNKSLENQGGNEMPLGANPDKFTVTDGVFSYDIGALSGAKNDSVAEMMSFVAYDITMKFAKQIKEATNGTVSEDGRSLHLQGDFGEVIKKEKELSVDVSFNTFKDDKNK